MHGRFFGLVPGGDSAWGVRRATRLREARSFLRPPKRASRRGGGGRKAHGGSALSRQPARQSRHDRKRLDRPGPICKLKAQQPERPLPKPKRPKKAKPTTTEMSTGEATVATLLAHGLDTVYA